MNPPAQKRQLVAVTALLLAGFGWFAWHLFDIQIRRGPALRQQARKFTDVIRIEEPQRGKILDRNTNEVCFSVPVYSIYVYLPLCAGRTGPIAETCGKVLNVSPAQCKQFLDFALKQETNFATAPRNLLLLRNVPPAQWYAIHSSLLLESFGFDVTHLAPRDQGLLYKLRRKLLYAEKSEVRRAPYGSAAAQVVGFALPETNGLALAGMSGVERSCNTFLAGIEGKCISERDASDNELPWRRKSYVPAVNGKNVVLTIDMPLQQAIQGTLEAACLKYKARSASAIIMDPQTFEIIAVATAPGFNPEAPGSYPPDYWANPVFTDRVEPGSSIKMIVLASVLDQGKFNLDSGVYCERGRYVVDHVTVVDHVPYGLLTLSDGFKVSSDIMFSKLGLSLGAPALYRQLMNFGFNQRTGTKFIREAAGQISSPGNWDTMYLTHAAYGQGICVTLLQMASATCVIANGGFLMRPTLVSRLESPDGREAQAFKPEFLRRVISPQTAAGVREGMMGVASPGGTGAGAVLDNWTVALKTGTGKKSDSVGYQAGLHYSDVVGMIPAGKPRMVICVAIDEPKVGYYAADVAVPVFRTIAQQTATRFNIPPDKSPGATPPAPRAPATIATMASQPAAQRTATASRAPAPNFVTASTQ